MCPLQPLLFLVNVFFAVQESLVSEEIVHDLDTCEVTVEGEELNPEQESLEVDMARLQQKGIEVSHSDLGVVFTGEGLELSRRGEGREGSGLPAACRCALVHPSRTGTFCTWTGTRAVLHAGWGRAHSSTCPWTEKCLLALLLFLESESHGGVATDLADPSA